MSYLRQDPAMDIQAAQDEATAALAHAARTGTCQHPLRRLEGGDDATGFVVSLNGSRVELDISAGGMTVNLPALSLQAAHELACMLVRVLGAQDAAAEARRFHARRVEA